MNDTDLPPRQRRAPATLQPIAQAPPLPRPPGDFMPCHENLGAMCGHGAFAAALGISVREACGHFPELTPKRGHVNLPEMEAALRRADAGYHSTYDRWPDAHGVFQTGLVILQWIGSWLDAGVPPGAACRHTHWIATCGGGREETGGLVYDVNLGTWTTRARYESALNCMLRQQLDPKSTGWRVKRGYEVAPLLRRS